jgi:hypothetical protein
MWLSNGEVGWKADIRTILRELSDCSASPGTAVWKSWPTAGPGLRAKNPALSEARPNIYGDITAHLDDVAKDKWVMERDDDLTALPLVDDPKVKDVFA